MQPKKSRSRTCEESLGARDASGEALAVFREASYYVYTRDAIYSGKKINIRTSVCTALRSPSCSPYASSPDRLTLPLLRRTLTRLLLHSRRVRLSYIFRLALLAILNRRQSQPLPRRQRFRSPNSFPSAQLPQYGDGGETYLPLSKPQLHLASSLRRNPLIILQAAAHHTRSDG